MKECKTVIAYYRPAYYILKPLAEKASEFMGAGKKLKDK
jgi:hypothetical protein